MESGDRQDVARAYVERLESSLAEALHRRDLEEEKARLAGAGVQQLELRLERAGRERERERAEAERERTKLERERAKVERQLERRTSQAEKERVEVERELERRLSQAEKQHAEAARELERRASQAEKELERQALATERKLASQAKEAEAERERQVRDAERALERQAAEAERELERQAKEAERELERQAKEAERARERHAAEAERVRERQAAEAERVRERQAAEAAQRLTRAEGDLAQVRGDLAARDAELDRLRAGLRERERKLALAEARLEKAQQRAERFRASLVDLRGGRAYRLMRVLWRLRRPFRRAPREVAPAEPGGEEADASSPAPAGSVALAERKRPARRPGERLRVASILDKMSAACLAPECELVPLTLEGWPEQLDERPPDLLLVESAWNANGGEWQYRIAQYPRKDLVGLPALRELVDGCRERAIPTAFWNKEDPVHFDRFAEAASLFEHVFTTDASCLERYRTLPGERTVTPLPFAAQPRIHNPAAVVPERSASPCFAGAWYRDRHPDRRRALEGLLDAARPYGLVIYDRRFGEDGNAFGFPDRFAPHVLGKLPYDRILDVYKTHRVFLNANSVVDSPTMCSRRVFELAACDTAILSTPAAALAALLGAGVVEEVADEASAAAALERMLGDGAERRRRIRTGRRTVFARHTYAHRLATIAETIGLDASYLRREQFAAPGGDGNGAVHDASAGDDRPWQLVLAPGASLSANALADLAAAATFADADAIGARPARNGDAAVEHRPVPELDPRVLLLRRELVASRGRPSGSAEQIHARLREWAEDGVRLYAADADLVTPGPA